MNWIEMFGDDMKTFGKGLDLRMSNWMPSSTTCPETSLSDNAYDHWVQTEKTSKRKFDHDHRAWQAANSLDAALRAEGCAAAVEHACENHPSVVAWWWKLRGCQGCTKTYNSKVEVLCACRPELQGHPLIRPLTPKKAKVHRRNTERTLEQDERRNQRRAYTVTKYPYSSARKGTDTNLDSFTGRILSGRPTLQCLGRNFVRSPGGFWKL
eukprot:GEMP01064356.1.p1 GENE.GEMP01064356.1~~GEMP01064356.1.p1  ORF type:complete len:210 (+),score=23.38 GEMP01064356.1:106-735(+)